MQRAWKSYSHCFNKKVLNKLNYFSSSLVLSGITPLINHLHTNPWKCFGGIQNRTEMKEHFYEIQDDVGNSFSYELSISNRRYL